MLDTSHRIVVVATRNKGKVREFASLLEPLGLSVRSLADYEGLPDIVEDCDTFAGNALKKASVIAQALGGMALADDSGLCVDALNGAPGVYSARYAGDGATDADNNQKLREQLLQVTGGPRAELGHPQALSAGRYVCALALVWPPYVDASGGKDATPLIVEATCDGILLAQPAGTNGFGYDPYFYVPSFGKTMAELTMEEKNQISHRAMALKQLIDRLS